MATKRIFDLAVVTGTYNTQEGVKNRYKNIGGFFQNDDGSEFITLDASFNPAGVPRKEGSDSIFISMFTPKEKAQPAPAANSRNSNTRGAPPASHGRNQHDAF